MSFFLIFFLLPVVLDLHSWRVGQKWSRERNTVRCLLQKHIIKSFKEDYWKMFVFLKKQQHTPDFTEAIEIQEEGKYVGWFYSLSTFKMRKQVCSNKRSKLKGTNGEIPGVSWEKQKEEPCNAREEADSDRAFLITKAGLNWVCLTQSLPLAMLGHWRKPGRTINKIKRLRIQLPLKKAEIHKCCALRA